MKELKFECKLLSDVVLKSTSATQGNTENLDYIPGAKFLGIAAKSLYDEADVNKTLDLFHNNTVQFGDAHICIKGNRTIKVPASWFFNKGEGIGDTKYLHHKITDKIALALSEDDKQLKQARKGYFTENKYINTDSNFSIKSAYDSEKRRAKDSQMYGYFALPKGSLWGFTVRTKDEYIDEIKNALEGRKRIGRSRSAEYGLIEIRFKEYHEKVSKNDIIPAGEVLVYAESNLCFYDKFGQNTLTPNVEQLGFSSESQILWDKSQIRTRKYQTWNSKRYNRDSDRVIIEKGSVFVIKTNTEVKISDFYNGLGAHKNEGFGKVLINPEFLMSENEVLNLKLEKFENTDDSAYAIKEGAKDDLLIDYLKSQKSEKDRVLSVDKLVNKFINEYKTKFSGISPSQWGQVRNYAKHAANEKVLYKLLFANETGYFMHGQSEHKWRAGNKRWILEEYIFGKTSFVPEGSKIEFTQKLAAEMGKHVKSKK